MIATLNEPYVEVRKLVSISTENVVVPKSNADVYRQMKVGDKIETTDENRGAVYNNANRAFREARFVTRKIEGKVYLIRTA